MAPQAGSSGLVGSPLETEEQLKRRMMAKRQKIIAEMIQTEKDYLNDLELCIRIVVGPLRRRQIARFDVDGLFSNIESVYHISTKLLSALEEATANVEPAMQVIGQVFLQIKDLLEDAYKIYCYHHDDAHMLLECYEKDEELKEHIRDCLQSLKKLYEEGGKPNLLDMGSLMIKPIQRVMKYPLLLCELLNATPLSHPDHNALQDAVVAVKAMNMNINELKRRKDIGSEDMNVAYIIRGRTRNQGKVQIREVQDTGSECDSFNSSVGRKQSPPSSLEIYQPLSPQKISREELSLEESSTGDSSSLTADISRGSPDCVGMTETKSMIFSPASKVYNGILEKSCSMNQLSSGVVVSKPRHTSCSSTGSESKAGHEPSAIPQISSASQDLCQNGERNKKSSKIKSLFKKKSK